MAPIDLRQRTKRFALDTVLVVESLPRSPTADVVGRQLLRSGTSVAANCRSAWRARSRKEFIAKLGIVEEEADESLFWIEVVADAGLLRREQVESLRDEASQLVAITVASLKTARRHSSVRRSPLHVPRSS